jgi:DNA recombination protein RmuC
MSEYLLMILLAGMAALLGAYIGNLRAQNRHRASQVKLEARMEEMSYREEKIGEQLVRTEDERDGIRKERDQLNEMLIRQQEENRHLGQRMEEQQGELEKLQEKFQKEFENMANQILEAKSKKFTEQNKEHLELVLNPLAEKIKLFEKKVEETNKESIDRHATLRQQIDNLQKLNEQMSKEAVNLTRALKGDSKTQGDWGETQLEVLLEKAGLRKEVHFSTQGGFRDEEGKLKKPDFIINLPENKHLIVDAKVSLTAYESYFNAESEEEKAGALKRHIESIRKHIKDLGEKRYSDLYGINTPDYVLMFVPVEPALLVALNDNQALYMEALERNVVMVSTSTLLATLSTVASIWKQEDQKQNVQEIVRQAGMLYDKFEGFVQDLLRVGKSINTAKEGYDSAMNKLSTGRGNLVRRVEKLRELGVAPKKELPKKLIDRSAEDAEDDLSLDELE